jgi:hypothetical protein
VFIDAPERIFAVVRDFIASPAANGQLSARQRDGAAKRPKSKNIRGQVHLTLAAITIMA